MKGSCKKVRYQLIVFSSATLVILAKDDRFIPADTLRLLDDGELVELGSGTHWVAGEEPERIGGMLADFFGRPTAGTQN